MDVCDNDEAYVNAILHDSDHGHLSSSCNNTMQSDSSINTDTKSSTHECSEKHSNSAIWTTSATSTLLKLYESKLTMLETPKKKTRIWMAISENLKDYQIDMTPDQIRWKINALTKKYKQCIDNGQHEKFRYFKEMDDIYAQYNVDCDSYTITDLLHKKKDIGKIQPCNEELKPCAESKAMIELRKIRLANRIESDRNQGKIQLERQWLEYLKRKEEQNQWRDEMYERHLKIREEELELKKRELELKESLEYKKIELMEKEQEDLLHIEREKCELLKQLFNV
ncbi:uncharacterized protein LOC115449498 [Manduca sexta]|uniref:Myb/SANT-like DNA-binding domain-containing protein n=1 Tax=Manduca sexta TaxID=7130 RepID=A0A921ZLN0_MANSE|nr:uncharacterized protein LOC115449498 [Manduca sexta]KAG6459504.1 hypothetical protein O3G_MSEX011409 [Manduca sexta]